MYIRVQEEMNRFDNKNKKHVLFLAYLTGSVADGHFLGKTYRRDTVQEGCGKQTMLIAHSKDLQGKSKQILHQATQ